MTERRPILRELHVRTGDMTYAIIHTSDSIIVARAHYRPPARVPICRGDSFVVFTFRTQRCRAHHWLVELLNVLELELKHAIASDLLARVRTKMGTDEKATIDAPEPSGVFVHPRL